MMLTDAKLPTPILKASKLVRSIITIQKKQVEFLCLPKIPIKRPLQTCLNGNPTPPINQRYLPIKAGLVVYGIWPTAWPPTLLMLPVFMIAGVLSGMMGSDDQDPMASGIFLVIAGAAYLFIIVFSFIFAKRRFNDMDQSGWLSLLMLIPLVNLIVGLVLIFAPCTPTSNKYGLRPGHNTMWVQIGAFALPVTAILGILAAIAIPAYSDYAERARQAESQYSE